MTRKAAPCPLVPTAHFRVARVGRAGTLTSPRDCRRVAFSLSCRLISIHSRQVTTQDLSPHSPIALAQEILSDLLHVMTRHRRDLSLVPYGSFIVFWVSSLTRAGVLTTHQSYEVLFDPLCFETSQFEPGEVSLSEKMGVRNAGWSPPVVTLPRQRCVSVPEPVQSLGTSSREDPRDASAPRVTHRSAPASRTVRQVASRIFTRRRSSWPHRLRRR